ncbi:MAG: hypothetical protein RI909_787, partial [Bacteroidota bacterium]
KSINYSGKIILECRWENLAIQAKPAYDFLLNEISRVYKAQ